jgi:hypothetical protein
MYGDDARLTTGNAPEGGAVVTVEVPLRGVWGDGTSEAAAEWVREPAGAA